MIVTKNICNHDDDKPFLLKTRTSI